MNDYRFPDNKITRIAFPVMLLMLQMVARSTMYTSTFLGFARSQITMIGLVLVTGLTFLIYNRKHLKKMLKDQRMLAFAFAAVVVLGPMLIKQDWQLMYFTILLGWLFAIFLTYFATLREVAGYYVRILFFLSIWMLVGQFILKPLANMGIIPGFPFDSPGGWHMYNFGLTFAVNRNTEMVDALRVFGIFREPGLYQIFLFIAIHLNNYHVDWDREWKLWLVNAVLFVSLLITFCTGGVLALALYIVFLFFDKGLYRNRQLQILAMILVAAVTVLLIIAVARSDTWAMELVWMIQKVFEKTDSYTTRVDSVFMDAEIFFRHPLVGATLQEVLYSVPNNTATSPILFAAFGIFGGCVHVLSWAALAWKKERSVLMNLLLMVILFVPFNTQNVIYDMFFWLFPIMALTEQALPLLEKCKKKV